MAKKKILGNFRKNVILEQCKRVHCVDLGETFQTHIYLQILTSIQPRTSPVNFGRSSIAASRPYSEGRGSGARQPARPSVRPSKLSNFHDIVNLKIRIFRFSAYIPRFRPCVRPSTVRPSVRPFFVRPPVQGQRFHDIFMNI